MCGLWSRARSGATLHETPEGRKAQAHPPRAGQDPFRRRWRTWLDRSPDGKARLTAMTRAFVEAQVVTHFGEPAVYQAEPTLRVHLAGTGRSLGVPHVDADYFHQPGELNWWLPLTPCWGSNTLWCESEPGAADYAPFELRGPGSYRYGAALGADFRSSQPLMCAPVVRARVRARVHVNMRALCASALRVCT